MKLLTAKEEYEMLKSVREDISNGNWYRFMRYERVLDSLIKFNFPYKLVQTSRDDIGSLHRGYFYYWRSDWDRSCFYIEETQARGLFRTPRQALEVLSTFLLQRSSAGSSRCVA